MVKISWSNDWTIICTFSAFFFLYVKNAILLAFNCWIVLSLTVLWRASLWMILCRVRAYIQMKMVASYMGHMLMVNSMALLKSLIVRGAWCFRVSTKITVAVETAGYSITWVNSTFIDSTCSYFVHVQQCPLLNEKYLVYTLNLFR